MPTRSDVGEEMKGGRNTKNEIQNEKIRRLVWSLLPAYMRERIRSQEDVESAALDAAEEEEKASGAGRRRAAIKEILLASRRLQEERQDAEVWEAVEAAVAEQGSTEQETSTQSCRKSASVPPTATQRGPPGPGEHKKRILELRTKSEMFRQRCATAALETISIQPATEAPSTEPAADAMDDAAVFGNSPDGVDRRSRTPVSFVPHSMPSTFAAATRTVDALTEVSELEDPEEAQLAMAIMTEGVPFGGAPFLQPVSRMPIAEQHELAVLTGPKLVAATVERDLRRTTLDGMSDELHAASALLASMAVIPPGAGGDALSPECSATQGKGSTAPFNQTKTKRAQLTITAGAPRAADGTTNLFLELHPLHHHPDWLPSDAQRLALLPAATHLPQGSGFANLVVHGMKGGYIGMGDVIPRPSSSSSRESSPPRSTAPPPSGPHRELETVDWRHGGGISVPLPSVNTSNAAIAEAVCVEGQGNTSYDTNRDGEGREGSATTVSSQRRVIAARCAMKPLTSSSTVRSTSDEMSFRAKEVFDRVRQSADDINLAKEALRLYDNNMTSKGSNLVCIPLPKMLASTSPQPSDELVAAHASSPHSRTQSPVMVGCGDVASCSVASWPTDAAIGFSRPPSAAAYSMGVELQPTKATAMNRSAPLSRPLSSASLGSQLPRLSKPASASIRRSSSAAPTTASLLNPSGLSVVDSFGRPVDMQKFTVPDELSLRTCILDATPHLVAKDRAAVALQRLTPPAVPHCVMEAVPPQLLTAALSPRDGGLCDSSGAQLRHTVPARHQGQPPRGMANMLLRWSKFQSISPEERVNSALPVALTAPRGSPLEKVLPMASKHKVAAHQLLPTTSGSRPLRGTHAQTMFCRKRQ